MSLRPPSHAPPTRRPRAAEELHASAQAQDKVKSGLLLEECLRASARQSEEWSTSRRLLHLRRIRGASLDLRRLLRRRRLLGLRRLDLRRRLRLLHRLELRRPGPTRSARSSEDDGARQTARAPRTQRGCSRGPPPRPTPREGKAMARPTKPQKSSR